jgi:hypothetical protein
MNSVLTGVGSERVVSEPFPHVVIENAIDDELCMELLNQFPPLEVVAQGADLGTNSRFSLPAHLAQKDEAVAAVWKEMVQAHVGPHFLDELIAVFGDAIRQSYPSFESDFGELDALRPGLRQVDSFGNADVLLDAQISVNTPVTGKPTSVRSAHLDDPSKLFAGLFYLRHPDDDSTGGDLEICRYRSRPRGFRGPLVYNRFVEPVSTVRYRRGTLVLFLNTPESLHGVTVRSRTDVPRYFMNLVAEVKAPLFTWDSFQATSMDKLIAAPEIVKRKLERATAG